MVDPWLSSRSLEVRSKNGKYAFLNNRCEWSYLLVLFRSLVANTLDETISCFEWFGLSIFQNKSKNNHHKV